MLWNSINVISIINNIFYNSSSYAIETYQASLNACIIDHNLVSGSSTVMPDTTDCSVLHTVFGNPNFVNPDAGNFQTQAGGVGIDPGLMISSVSTDIRGVSRPQGSWIDIGAYEFVP